MFCTHLLYSVQKYIFAQTEEFPTSREKYTRRFWWLKWIASIALLHDRDCTSSLDLWENQYHLWIMNFNVCLVYIVLKNFSGLRLKCFDWYKSSYEFSLNVYWILLFSAALKLNSSAKIICSKKKGQVQCHIISKATFTSCFKDDIAQGHRLNICAKVKKSIFLSKSP